VGTLANTDISTVVSSSKNLLDSSVSVANKSLDILEQGLEKVGTTAMNLLTEEISPSSSANPRRKPRFTLSGDDNEPKSPTDASSKEKAVKSPFEEFGGRVSKETLENVAVEALRKQQLLFRKLSPEQAQKVNEVTAAIQEIFDKEKHDENHLSAPTLVLGESELSQLNTVLAQLSSVKEGLNTKTASVTSEFNEFVSTLTDKKPESIAEYVAGKQKSLREECLSTLAKLSAQAVQQLLNAGQSNIKTTSSSTSSTLSKEQLVVLATSFCQLCEFVEQELTTITTLYVDAIQTLSLKGGESLAALIAAGGSAEHVQGVKKQVNLKTQAMRNLVYYDVGTENGHIQDCKRFLQNIIKFITIINSEEKLKEQLSTI